MEKGKIMRRMKQIQNVIERRMRVEGSKGIGKKMNKRQNERKTKVNRGWATQKHRFKPRHSYCIVYKHEQDWRIVQSTPLQGTVNQLMTTTMNTSL
jgi:hypothetical protein